MASGEVCRALPTIVWSMSDPWMPVRSRRARAACAARSIAEMSAKSVLYSIIGVRTPSMKTRSRTSISVRASVVKSISRLPPPLPCGGGSLEIDFTTEARTDMDVRDLVFIDGVRTPMIEYNTDFADISAIDLAAHAARALLERTGIQGSDIDHTIVGNALQTSPDAIYGARHVALKAGVPKEVPALTVNRLCGSGIQ